MAKKFNVSISVDIKEIKNDVATEFFATNTQYCDVGYDVVLAIEAALMESMQKMNGVGVQKAVAMGLTEGLKTFNLV